MSFTISITIKNATITVTDINHLVSECQVKCNLNRTINLGPVL